jgi:phosphatidylserine/phosphatidylglycerophosphate/cardiolipin synthase-like enzyme
MADAITIRTLTDGGQPALTVAGELAAFLAGARESLDIAAYDFHLGPETAVLVADAIRAAAARGVAVRFVYNVDHVNPIPVPPPPEPDVVLIASLGVPHKPIAGIPDLMHHKYVVRDGESIWTGSTNWTEDSFSRQENVVVVVESRGLAHAFALNFGEIWERDRVEATGLVDPRPVDIAGVEVRPWFTPGFGDALSHRIAKAIGRARRRVRICSPVISAAPILATLAEVVSEARVDLAGCVDATQAAQVRRQWFENRNAAWKVPLLEQVLAAPFSGKPSTPYDPAGSLHDFMHAKVTVADDVVFAGSFNLSRSGERNAENVLEVHDAALAERLAAYVDEVRARYPRMTLT